jgi:integrin beta 3
MGIAAPIPDTDGRPDSGYPARPVGQPGRGVRDEVGARVPVPTDATETGDGPAAAGEPGPGARGFRAARSELRRQIREQKRLRMVTLMVATLLLLGALPLYLGIRAATRDPVFNTLDSLAVPAWASVKVDDQISGSRWCIIECRFRERVAESERNPGETAPVYERALADSGWQRWNVALCPDQPVPEGERYTCWKRDEYTLDLWVREPACVDDPLRNRPTVAPTAPGAENNGAGPPPCAGSVVSIKVRNAIADDRGRPQPTQDPDFTGEDPDPLFTDDPLLEPTLSPS